MITKVYEFSGLLFLDQESAKKTADRWLMQLAPVRLKGFDWSDEPAVPIREPYIVWRGTARIGPLLIIADVVEKTVGG